MVAAKRRARGAVEECCTCTGGLALVDEEQLRPLKSFELPELVEDLDSYI